MGSNNNSQISIVNDIFFFIHSLGYCTQRVQRATITRVVIMRAHNMTAGRTRGVYGLSEPSASRYVVLVISSSSFFFLPAKAEIFITIRAYNIR